MNSPLVSVIIPCYNQGQFLMESLDSVKAQTYSNIEIIVVNDGSTDEETNRIINELNDPLIKIINKDNGGLSSARNAGIGIAKGEFLLPLDADDKIGSQYIQKSLEVFDADPKAGIVFCKGKYFGAINKNMDNEYVSFRSEMLYNAIFCSGIFRKKDCIAVGMYKTDFRKGMEDWDFLVRFLADGKKVVQLPEVLFFYRKTGTSMWDDLAKGSTYKIDMENLVFKNNIELYMKEWGSMIQVLREYEILKQNNKDINYAVTEVKNTLSYKIGNAILWPLKKLRAVKSLKE